MCFSILPTPTICLLGETENAGMQILCNLSDINSCNLGEHIFLQEIRGLQDVEWLLQI